MGVVYNSCKAVYFTALTTGLVVKFGIVAIVD